MNLASTGSSGVAVCCGALSTTCIKDWEKNRQAETKDLKDRRIVPRYSMGLISFTKKGKLTEQIEDDTIP